MRNKPTLILLACLSACASPTPQQQAKLLEILTVACNVDGTIVPVAQPIVATLGAAGATASSVDLLVHPAVISTCQALKGVPVSATPVAAATLPPASPAVASSP